MTEARRLLDDSGRRSVPADPDGVWPSAPVRELIEEFESLS